MKRTLNFCKIHWRKIAWAAIGAPIGTLGTQLHEPYCTWCFVVAAFCSIMAALDFGDKKNVDTGLPK